MVLPRRARHQDAQSPPSGARYLSEQGRALLKRLEGEVKRRDRHVVYDDATGKALKAGSLARGHATIGWGHLVGPEERFPVKGISDTHAEVILTRDLEPVERIVDVRVKVPLSQSQFDALVIFTFNIGIAGFLESTALTRLNAGDYAGAAEAMGWWKKVTDRKTGFKVISEGLVERRAAEIALFKSEPPPEPPPRPQPEPPTKARRRGPFSWLRRWLS
ncbi:MAG: lysozyme [Alphaproteobacteria bacterium]|nr:lysozyme [Alphaproteobacteria bacterium]